MTDLHTLQGMQNHFNRNRKILEIGAGLGAVTDYFLEHEFSLTLCEKDHSLVNYLRDKYHCVHDRTIEIIHADFLSVPTETWQKKNIEFCIANLPFHITTDVILRIIKEMPFVEKTLLGVQWEVAQRLIDKKKKQLSIHFAPGLWRYEIPR